MLLGGTLALYQVDEKSFWLDEVMSVVFARSDWPSFVHTLWTRELNMGLYYLFLRPWIWLGIDEFTVRSLSCLFAVSALLPFYGLSRTLFGRRVGLTAALLLATNPFFVRYAQEARGYSLSILLATLASLAFVRLLQQPTRALWIGYATCALLAAYAHFFASFVLIAHGISLLFIDRRRVPWLGLIICNVVIGLGLIPIGLHARIVGTGGILWIAPATPYDVLELFESLAGGRSQLFAYTLACVVGAVSAPGLARTDLGVPARWTRAFLLLWLVLPIVLAYGVSLVQPLFISRYLSLCLPPMVLLVALGIARIAELGWHKSFALVLALVLALQAYGLFTWYADTEKENWRGAASYVLEDARQGDAVLFFSFYVQHPFEYYLERLNAPPGLLTTIPTEAGNPSDEQLGPYRRAWLVVSHAEFDHPLLLQLEQRLVQRFGKPRSREFYGVEVRLYGEAG